MKNHILTYNQLNESNELDDLSYNEVERLVDLGLLSGDLLKIYNYVKNGSSGELDLAHSMLTHLPNWLTKVEGNLVLSNSNIEKIPNSLTVTGDIVAPDSMLNTIEILVSHRSLLLDNCKITKLPDGLIVHGYLSVEGIQFEQFPKNLVIKGNFYIKNSNLEQFSNEELREMYDIHGAIIRSIFK